MTKKAIIFSSISKSGAKLDYGRYKPDFFVKCAKPDDLKGAPTDIGKVDYLLVTGGHGDFQTGKPTTFNDVGVAIAEGWIGKAVGEAKAIVLDFCFSTAMAVPLLKLLPVGGCVICAHGEAEGWFATLDPTADAARKVGEVIATASRNVTALTGGGSSASLMVKAGKDISLYTAIGGTGRNANLKKRREILQFGETEKELDELDKYVTSQGVKIHVETPEAVAARIDGALPMALI